MSTLDIKLPEHIRFVELLRPMPLGDCYCRRGDVIAIEQPITRRAATIMPIDPMLYFDRAQVMIAKGWARAHPGPATIRLGLSIRKPITASAGQEVEQEVIVDPGRRTATAAPQRKAGTI